MFFVFINPKRTTLLHIDLTIFWKLTKFVEQVDKRIEELKSLAVEDDEVEEILEGK